MEFTTLHFRNWRIHQTKEIMNILKGVRLIAQTNIARYYGQDKIAAKMDPYTKIEISPDEKELTSHLEEIRQRLNNTFDILVGESQNHDVDDIDWDTMRE